MPHDVFDLPGIDAFLRSQKNGKLDWVQPNPYDDETYTAREVRALLWLAMTETEQRVRQSLSAQLHETIRDAIQQTEYRLQDKLDSLTTASPTTNPSQTNAPPFSQLVKIEAELYENFRKPKHERTRNQAHVQLKLKAWTADHQCNGYWLLPLHRPDRADGRKRIKGILPLLHEIPDILYAGCFGSPDDGLDATSIADTCQTAIVNNKYALTMIVNGECLSFSEPKTKHETYQKHAPDRRWFWNKVDTQPASE